MKKSFFNPLVWLLVLAGLIIPSSQILAQDDLGFSGINLSPLVLNQQEINAGSNLSGKFTLKNTSGSAISDLRYKLRLFEKAIVNQKEGYIDNTPRVPIDTVIAPEIISVASGEEKTIEFKYPTPKNVKSDDYLFVVELFRNSGEMLDWQSNKVKITGGNAKYINLSDVEFLANGQPAESPIAGISVTPDDKIEASFTVDNNINLKNCYYCFPFLFKYETNLFTMQLLNEQNTCKLSRELYRLCNRDFYRYHWL